MTNSLLRSVKIDQPRLNIIPDNDKVFALDKIQFDLQPTNPQSNFNFETSLNRQKESSLTEFEAYRTSANAYSKMLGSVSLLGYMQCFEIHERDPIDDLSIDTWVFTRCR